MAFANKYFHQQLFADKLVLGIDRQKIPVLLETLVQLFPVFGVKAELLL
jgi:hypothetical protein